jgi:hypothetical protein
MACSFGYDIQIVNDSDESIEIRYKISERGSFDEPTIKNIEDWKAEKSIRRFWTEVKPWQKMPKSEYRTDLTIRERTIVIQPQQIINIEHGNYNPISEERGELTGIEEIKINSPNREIFYKGKLLLKQFEKDGYTFIKTYRNEFKEKDLR